jgi:hypothetical protein
MMPAVSSSWITSIDRDDTTGDVTVRTRNGREYTYAGIDEATFQSWVQSPSPGGFFARHISDRYPSRTP